MIKILANFQIEIFFNKTTFAIVRNGLIKYIETILEIKKKD